MYKTLRWTMLPELVIRGTFCVVILITLSGCATNSRVIRDYCLVYEPVHYSKSKDTKETQEQTDRNNAVYLDLCTEARYME